MLSQTIPYQDFKGLNINGLHKSSIFTKMPERLWPRDCHHTNHVLAITEKRALFGYHFNCDMAGRWAPPDMSMPATTLHR